MTRSRLHHPAPPPSPKLGRRALVHLVAASFGVGWLTSVVGRAQPSASGFVLIVNRACPERSVRREFVEGAFLKKISRWDDGEPIRPVDRNAESSVRRRFTETMLRRSVAAVRSYWQQRIFSGRDTPPPELDEDEAVVRYVMKYRGAVGYVSAGTELGDARILELR